MNLDAEYRDLPDDGGKVAPSTLAQETCTKPHRRKSKASSFCM
ncbi:hypothetical protein [Thermoanaerobacterium sp. RBIITD]|nr:hypothetical protein [Thermoanaerobacterium sp. RBIITD]